MRIGEVATRTELSLRTIRHYEETGLVVPSARSRGGFRLYTEADVARLMVIRRMKPLGFTLDEMRDLLDATDRLDREQARANRDTEAEEGWNASPGTGGETPDSAGGAGELGHTREALLERVREYESAATRKIEELRVQLARAEDFAATLRSRLESVEQTASACSASSDREA